jgi:hypothetical protein
MTTNTSDKLRQGVYYPVADRVPGNQQLATGERFMAIWNGRPRRSPKRGEWYLSGAKIAAYRAPSDLSTPYHIAQLRIVQTRTVTEMVSVKEV